MVIDETTASSVSEETTETSTAVEETTETSVNTEETAEETTVTSEETSSSEAFPHFRESEVTEEKFYYDISLFLPDYGYISGTVSETHTAEVLKSLEELKSSQQRHNDLLCIAVCIMCLMIGAVCGLLLTLHIKRR